MTAGHPEHLATLVVLAGFRPSETPGHRVDGCSSSRGALIADCVSRIYIGTVPGLLTSATCCGSAAGQSQAQVSLPVLLAAEIQD